MLIIMSLTFVACEPKDVNDDENKDKIENKDDQTGDENKNDQTEDENKNDQTEDENKDDQTGDDVKSNCEFFAANFSIDKFGKAIYVFEFATNGLDIANAKGTGEYIVIMMYAEPTKDGFPASKTYNFISFEDLTYMDTWEECVMGAYAMEENSLVGTFAYVIENDKAVDILLCTGGNIKFDGNTTNGTMTANLELTSGMTNEVSEKEFIYNGKFTIKEAREAAPSRVMKLNR